jgi:hypothetical protein
MTVPDADPVAAGRARRPVGRHGQPMALSAGLPVTTEDLGAQTRAG